MVEGEFCHEWFDADVEGGELHLAKIAILQKAASEIPQIFWPDAELVVVFSGRVRVNVDLLAMITANLFLHIINAGLINFGRGQLRLYHADVARREAEFGRLFGDWWLNFIDLWGHFSTWWSFLIFGGVEVIPPRVFCPVFRGLKIDSFFFFDVVVITLPRYTTMTSLRKLSLFCLLFSRQSMISWIYVHGVIQLTILVFFHGNLTEPNFLAIRHL